MKNSLCLAVVLAAAAFSSPAGYAQSSKPPTAPETAEATSQPAPPAPGPLPIIDPARELTGVALVDALRKGGFVLYMRHTESGSPAETCDQSSLSAAGTENARLVGAALRELNIPVGNVRSSVPCRTNVTASTLGLGPVEITEDLNPLAPREGFDIGLARSRRLNEMPASAKNTVLVSHMHGSRKKEEWVHLQLGEIIVFRPVANARAEPVARVQVAAWAALKQLMADVAAR